MRVRALLAASLLAAPVLAAPRVAVAPPPPGPTWVYRKPIGLPALVAPAYAEAILDAEVYRDATPGLADLRVRDGRGGEVAYVLRRHEKPASRTEREVPLLDLQRTERGEVRFVLDLGTGPGIHNRVRIRVGAAARNFRVPVAIEVSEDRRAWQLVRLAGFIYVVEGETRAADTTVSYPPSTARYLRVTVLALPGPRFLVTGAAVIADTPAVRGEEAVSAELVERRDDTVRKVTELVLDLGSRRPADRAEVTIGDRTFHRVVLVEASDDRKVWRWLATGALSAVETARVRERHTHLAFPEASARYLRLTIQNQDDRPLRVSEVRLAGVRHGVVFQAAPAQTYTLDYGDRTRPLPRYDLSRTFPYVESEVIPVATLGPATREDLPPPRKPWTEERPILLWGAMGIVALALVGLLVRLGRRVRPTLDAGGG
ncbi:MAG: DUF3999 family protein [Candidatus Rokubacteria bacterium]|nr:DUF3999 family protein [Candidatus Rokubacteria bacterium]